MELKKLSLKDIQESKENPRIISADSIKELAASMKSVGLLQPIIVRECDDGFVLVSGHRRIAAAAELEWDTIDSLLLPKSMTDDDSARLIQVVENLHRKDLNPMEEARAFQNLLDQQKMEAGDLHAMLDKSLSYVTRALSLLSIPKDVQRLIEEGKLTAAHGHQIARIDPKHQASAAKFAATYDTWRKSYPTVADLRKFIGQRVEKDLKLAPFPKDVQFAAKVACTVCPFNTGNQGTLFDGAESGHCTNPSCYNTKEKTFYKIFQADAERRHPGVKCLGSMKSYYSEDRVAMKGYRVVDPKKVAEKMKKSPKDFGFVINKPSAWSSGNGKSPKIFFVDLTKKDDSNAHMSHDESLEEGKRERFVHHAALVSLLGKAVAVWDAKSNKRPLIRLLCMESIGGSYEIRDAIAEAFPKRFRDKDLTKLTDDDLILFATLCTIDSYDRDFKDLLWFEIDKADVKEARKAATTAYDSTKGKKEVPA